MTIECTYICSYCFQVNTIVVDVSAGDEQEYIEDCGVCCRPNRLIISVDADQMTATVEADVP